MCLQGIRYLAYPIRSSFVIKDASRRLAAHADLCRAPRGMILWARPPLAARPIYSLWVSGVIPPQLVPERLVSAEQRHLELVRAV
jgi:hypothetical protein